MEESKRRIGDKIKCVHLKDRLFNEGPSVSNFAGDTDFDLIFKELSKINYDGLFTLQMARQTSGHEYTTIQNYVNYFRKLYERYF